MEDVFRQNTPCTQRVRNVLVTLLEKYEGIDSKQKSSTHREESMYFKQEGMQSWRKAARAQSTVAKQYSKMLCVYQIALRGGIRALVFGTSLQQHERRPYELPNI